MSKKNKLWVVKAGSQMVIEGGQALITSWMRQARTLKTDFGIDVIWVTSGAIATARKNTAASFKKTTAKSLAEKQALSALGQPMVMQMYNTALAKQGLIGSQVLLTADDLGNRKRRANLMNTLSTLVAWGALPILNENDAVSTEEIQFGDNDRLSALVAGHMKADRLVLLTDVDGLYDSDPKKNPDAKLITKLDAISGALVRSLSGQSGSNVGTGGMLSKILAAKTARAAGIVTHLAKGDEKNVILKLAAADRRIGTTIYPKAKK